jgi:hypothetical protein
MSKASVETISRNEALEVVKNAIGQHYDLSDEQICVISASEIAIPIVDANGDDSWVLIKVSIPRGTRNGTGGYNPYDGYAAAEDYKMTHNCCGAWYTYEFTPTSLGISGVIKCSCGDEFEFQSI